MNKKDKVLVLGSRGLVGSAIVRALKNEGHENILMPTRSELDLLLQADVHDYFKKNKPEFVFFAAAKVGGILANDKFKADFIYENLTIQNNVFGATFHFPVKKFLFLGSSCIYPKESPQPIKEEYLLTGPLEHTNEAYAIAKIAGVKMASAFKQQYGCNYLSIMPTNLYGVNDNFNLETSHVIPGLIARMVKAKNIGRSEFKVWGTGEPRRDFLFVDDLARACLHVMKTESQYDILNVGSGYDISIRELVKKLIEIIGYEGEIVFDSSKPDGTLRKLLDISKISDLGWKPSTSLEEGLRETVNFYYKRHCGSKENI